MRSFAEFLKTTCIGGFFIILPVGLLIIILMKFVDMVQPLAVPVAELLPQRFRYPLAIGFVIMLSVSFVAGLLAMTRLGRNIGSFLEHSTLDRIPGYHILRSLTHRIGNIDETSKFAPAFVEIEEALVMAFIIEELPDGKYTVFVPSVPTLAGGAVYVIDGDRVHRLNASFMSAAKCVTHFGVGSGKLHATLNAQSAEPG